MTTASAPWRARLLGTLWAGLLRLQSATWRTEVEGLAAFDADLARSRGVIAAFWHGTYIPLFVLLRGRNAMVFTSLSTRGGVISAICRHFGYRAEQIRDHGGDASLESMLRVLSRPERSTRVAGLAVDGPLGPRHQAKRGAVQLAAALGWLIYPMSVASSRKKIFVERWDRREMPKAFSRVALVVGEPLEPPAELDDPLPWQERLEEALHATDRRAAELVGPEALSGLARNLI